MAAVVFLAGLVLFLGPQVNGWLGQRNSDSAIDTFEAELPAGEASSGEEDSGKAADGDTSEDSEEGESGARRGKRPAQAGQRDGRFRFQILQANNAVAVHRQQRHLKPLFLQRRQGVENSVMLNS